jgi:hypothetical protein
MASSSLKTSTICISLLPHSTTARITAVYRLILCSPTLTSAAWVEYVRATVNRGCHAWTNQHKLWSAVIHLESSTHLSTLQLLLQILRQDLKVTGIYPFKGVMLTEEEHLCFYVTDRQTAPPTNTAASNGKGMRQYNQDPQRSSSRIIPFEQSLSWTMPFVKCISYSWRYPSFLKSCKQEWGS